MPLVRLKLQAFIGPCDHPIEHPERPTVSFFWPNPPLVGTLILCTLDLASEPVQVAVGPKREEIVPMDQYYQPPLAVHEQART